jgi:23S rRNA pseudouridine2605 synthase
LSEGAERLHKFLANCGVASRRKAEDLIRDGRVAVNGGIVAVAGAKVSPGDVVQVDGREVRRPRLSYVLLNKPKGVVTTMEDPHGRRTVAQLLPDVGAPLKPAGRLDQDTEGLLICTNDGELAMRLTHPRYGVEKGYLAVVQGAPSDRALESLREGVVIEGRRTARARVEALRIGQDRSTIRLVVREGRKRQVRLMLQAVGHPVLELRRVRIGPVVARGLALGACRPLTQPEVLALRRLVGLA